MLRYANQWSKSVSLFNQMRFSHPLLPKIKSTGPRFSGSVSAFSKTKLGWNYGLYRMIVLKRQVFVKNSLKGILLVNFPEKEKNFLIKNLAAENKLPLISQSGIFLLKNPKNMDDLVGSDDPIQVLLDKVKASVPCICFINDLDRIGKQRREQLPRSTNWSDKSLPSPSHFFRQGPYRKTSFFE